MDQIVSLIDQILHLTDSTAVNLAILAALCLIVFAVAKKVVRRTVTAAVWAAVPAVLATMTGFAH